MRNTRCQCPLHRLWENESDQAYWDYSCECPCEKCLAAKLRSATAKIGNAIRQLTGSEPDFATALLELSAVIDVLVRKEMNRSTSKLDKRKREG